MARAYEVIFIVEPNVSDEQLKTIVQQLKDCIAKEDGQLARVERWGKRKLAYPVKKFLEGYYILFLIQGTHRAVEELERRFKVMESIIKFSTVRVDWELKKMGKWPLQIEPEEEPEPEEKEEISPLEAPLAAEPKSAERSDATEVEHREAEEPAPVPEAGEGTIEGADSGEPGQTPETGEGKVEGEDQTDKKEGAEHA